MSTAVADGTYLSIAINGDQIQGLLHASIATSNCFSADSFALTFAIGAAPLGDLEFWSSLSTAYAEVAANGLTAESLITGRIDTILIDPILGTVAIEGRDLSSSMIDSYRQHDFVNQSASEVVSTIAQYHGLSAAVAPTSGSVGRYFGDGYTQLSLGQFSRHRSDWDLIVQLARENEFDVFVLGTTLFFQPATGPPDTPVPLAIADLQRIRVERALAISSNAAARVQSWNSQHMSSYDSNMPTAEARPAEVPSGPTSQAFLFSSSNLSSKQVTDAASRYAAEIGRLATTMHVDMPWDFSLSPRTTISVYGTNSALDRLYRIDSIERHYNSKSGSTQSIRAVGI